MRTQRSPFLATMIVVVVGSVLFMSGCSTMPREFPPSGASTPDVIAAREEAAKAEKELLTKAALGEPISESVQDYCEPGTNREPWGPRDPYYWSCGHVTSWVVGTDSEDPAELIAAYRAHLVSIGCEPSEPDFNRTAEYWAMYGVTGQNANGVRYTVDDLPDASALCAGDTVVGVGFRSSAEFDAATLVTYYPSDGEQITDQPHDQAAVRASDRTLVVTLRTSATYHYVPRVEVDPSPTTTTGPERCTCYSGSKCECPGG